MKAQASSLLVFLVLFATGRVIASSSDHRRSRLDLHSKTKNVQGYSKRVKVDLYFSGGLHSQAALLSQLVERSWKQLSEHTELFWQDDFAIYFNSTLNQHNGLATVIPDDRILIYTVVPQQNSSIFFSRDYLSNTILHELTHLLIIQQRRGLFRGLGWIFGNGSRPLGLWPRWLHEGTAVWVESKFGGRGLGGSLSLEKAKIAEYAADHSEEDFLKSWMMDGNYPAEAVSPGHLPYHLGYHLVEALLGADSKIKLDQFVRESSYDFGLSFRSQFRALGVDLDEVWQKQLSQWKKTSFPQKAANRNPKKRVATAKYIRGPWQSPWGSSWIEQDSRSSTKARLLSQDGKQIDWELSRWRPLSFFVYKDSYLLLVRQQKLSTNQSDDTALLLLDKKGRLKCRLEGWPERAAQMAMTDGRIVGSQMGEDARMESFTLPYPRDCKLQRAKRHRYSREAFEFVSLPEFSAGKSFWLRAAGRNTAKSFVESENLLIQSDWRLSHLRALPARACPQNQASHCLYMRLGHDEKKVRIGLLSLKAGKIMALHTARISGDPSWAIWDPAQEALVVSSKHWKEDRLSRLSKSDFEEDNAKSFRLWSGTQKEVSPKKLSVGARLEEYSPWKSFLPSFWYPIFAFGDESYIAGAGSFFSDIRNAWGGWATAGYDSYPELPFASLNLSRQKLELGDFDRFRIQAYLLPTVVFRRRQQRWGAIVDLRAVWPLGSSWALNFSPGIEYKEASESSGLKDYLFITPVLAASLYSRNFRDPANSLTRIWNQEASLSLGGSLRRLNRIDSRARVGVGLSGPFNSGFEASSVWAKTKAENFPASFFEWGGQAPVASVFPTYLNRGFPSRFFIARELVHSKVEWGYRLFRVSRGLAWNRMRLDDIGHRFVFDSTTARSYRRDERFEFGRQFFSSVGTEIDFWGGLFHYVGWKATLGVYKGFGPFGEWRGALSLRSHLDL